MLPDQIARGIVSGYPGTGSCKTQARLILPSSKATVDDEARRYMVRGKSAAFGVTAETGDGRWLRATWFVLVALPSH